MDNIIRDVRDIPDGDRLVFEQVLGQPLYSDQRLIVQIVSAQPTEASGPSPRSTPAELPEWCNVFKGLSDSEIAEIDKSIVRWRESRTIA